MTQQQKPTAKQRQPRGYLATPDALTKLQEKKVDTGYTYEDIASKAGLASDDQVKRLFHPDWGYKVEREAIEKIASVLDLKLADIADIFRVNQENALPEVNQHTEASIVVFQRQIETQTIEDKASATQLHDSIPLDSLGVRRQEMLSDIEVTSNLEVKGDLTQKAQRGSSVEQKMATNLKAENILLGNLTQES